MCEVKWSAIGERKRGGCGRRDRQDGREGRRGRGKGKGLDFVGSTPDPASWEICKSLRLYFHSLHVHPHNRMCVYTEKDPNKCAKTQLATCPRNRPIICPCVSYPPPPFSSSTIIPPSGPVLLPAILAHSWGRCWGRRPLGWRVE